MFSTQSFSSVPPYALAHGVRQKVAHLGVVAGTAVWSVDVAEGTLLDAGGQWCGKKAASLLDLDS